MNAYEKKMMGLRIKQAREAKGLTQDELAEKLKIKSRVSISNYEAGRSVPPGDVLRDLADILNTSTDYLLGRDKPFEPISTGERDIGWAIREERQALGLTQKELGDLIGVSQKQISNYELGVSPIDELTLEKLMRVFNTSYPAFLNKYNMWDEYIPPEFDGDVDKYLAFKKAEAEDAMRDPGYDIQTLAAHHDGEEWTEEELQEIEKFKEFVRMKRKMKQQE